MLSRELGEIGPYGGLLADAMGLGKTLQTLATMVGNPPAKEDIKAKTKATLIVLPASAIRQWKDEIEIHVEPGMFPKIIQYKAKFGISLALLQECDIILTSILTLNYTSGFLQLNNHRLCGGHGFFSLPECGRY